MRTAHLASLALAVLVAGGCDSNSTTQTATATIAPTAAPGSTVAGTVTFTQDGDELSMRLAITGATPGQHGFHIHTAGNCATGVDPGEGPTPIPAGTALGHYDPLSTMNHGGPSSAMTMRHAADFGNVTAGSDGRINETVKTTSLSLTGTNPVVGRAAMIHMGQDDLMTDPGGNSGMRFGCGVVSAATTASN